MGSGGLITHGTDRLQRSRQFLSSPSHPLRMASPRTTLLFLVYPRAQAADADLTVPSILFLLSSLFSPPISSLPISSSTRIPLAVFDRGIIRESWQNFALANIISLHYQVTNVTTHSLVADNKFYCLCQEKCELPSRIDISDSKQWTILVPCINLNFVT